MTDINPKAPQAPTEDNANPATDLTLITAEDSLENNEQPNSLIADAVDFARRNPTAVIVGGLAIGALAGALLTKKSTKTAALSKASGFASAATTAGLALGHNVIEHLESSARTGREKITEGASDVAHATSALADKTYDNASEAWSTLAKKALELAASARR